MQYAHGLLPTEAELAKEGLIELQMFWLNERRRIIEKHTQRYEKRCRTLRAQFFELSDQAKIDLWTKAVQKKIVQDGDQFAMLILPTLVPFMIEEFEQAVRNESLTGKMRQ